jgi:hypothetical protein
MVNSLIWHLFKIGAETDARALVGNLRDQLHGPATLDPSCDPPEVYCAAFDLLCEFWARKRVK